MDDESIIEVKEVVPRLEEVRFSRPISWKIGKGENWAIVGANGSGKSLLTKIMSGDFGLDSGEILYPGMSKTKLSQFIKIIEFHNIYSFIDGQTGFYQQRWNRGLEQNSPCVKDLLSSENPELLGKLITYWNIGDLLEKNIILLSSGELRKFLIVRAILTEPRILVLDNPYIGLDEKSRENLNGLFSHIEGLPQLQFILTASDPRDIPESIDYILPLKDKKLFPPLKRKDFFSKKEMEKVLFPKQTYNRDIAAGEENKDKLFYENVAVLKNIHVKYGNRNIIKDLDWTIKKGEKWALLGENGAGKSTLLSLLCGDNPQAYANDITLFDRKRGSGESIWDIKKRIGYISPEMNLYYRKNVKCFDIVCSGFFDTLGLYYKCSLQQEEIAVHWLADMGILHLKERSFLKISDGEKQLLLLARVLVKDPDLLILDEPLHGLDKEKKKFVRSIVEAFCRPADKTLIYVTHYRDEIPDIVDKYLHLKKIPENQSFIPSIIS